MNSDGQHYLCCETCGDYVNSSEAGAHRCNLSNGDQGVTRWIFYVQIEGSGADEDEAWRDACEQFALDPGEAPQTTLSEGETAGLQAAFTGISFSFPLACRHPDGNGDEQASVGT